MTKTVLNSILHEREHYCVSVCPIALLLEQLNSASIITITRDSAITTRDNAITTNDRAITTRDNAITTSIFDCITR